MKIIENRSVFIDVVVDVRCECCGESCLRHRNPDCSERMHLNASWGYFSGRDGEVWEADLCEKCAVKIEQFIDELGGTIRKSY